MSEEEPVEGKPRETHLIAHVVGSCLLWTVAWPLMDWILGDLVSLGASALKGAFLGAIFGVFLHIGDRLRLRRETHDS